MESQRDYLNRRAGEELGAAERASSKKVRELHIEMAERYREAADADPELRIRDEALCGGLPKDFRILE
jgi:hypothetical protein